MRLIGIVGLLHLTGSAIGLLHRRTFSPKWLLIAAGLVALSLLLPVLLHNFGNSISLLL